MRKHLLLAAAVFLALSAPAYAGHFNGSGAFVGKVSSSVSRLVNALHRTHDVRGFEHALASLVAHDPSLADDAVFVALSLPPEEQGFIVKALAEAYASLKPNNPDGAAEVKAALAYGPEGFVVAFDTELRLLSRVATRAGGYGGEGGGYGDGGGGGFGGGIGFGGGGGGGGGVVSPN